MVCSVNGNMLSSGAAEGMAIDLISKVAPSTTATLPHRQCTMPNPLNKLLLRRHKCPDSAHLVVTDDPSSTQQTDVS